MGVTVKELLAKFTGDTSGLEASSEKASAVVASFASKAAMAGLAAAGGFLVLAGVQSKAGDELGKLSQKYGVAVDAISRFDHAANLADVSTGQLATSFRFMQNSMVSAIQGSDAQATAFKALGLNARELIAMKPEQAFTLVADALSKVENPAKRTALAIDILGRSGADMLPMFKDGAAGLKAAADEADRFGLTINKIDSGELEKANDAVTKIGAAANGAARQFAVGLAPAISTVLEHLLKGVDYADSFRNAGATLGASLVEAMAFAETAIERVAIWLLKAQGYAMLAAQAIAGVSGGSTSEGFSSTLGDIDAAIADANKSINDKMSGKTSIITEYNTAIQNAAAATKKLGEESNKAGSVDIPLTAAALKAAADAAKKAHEEMIKMNNENADALIRMKDDLLGAGNAWEGMKKMALNALNEIGNNLIKLASGGTSGGGILGSLSGALFSGISNMFGGNTSWGGSQFGMIKWNAKGDVVNGKSVFPSSEGMQGMSENSPEGVLPLKRDKHGRLGVSASGSGGGGTTIINIQTGVAQTIRAEMARMIPSLRAEAIRAVYEAQARGIA